MTSLNKLNNTHKCVKCGSEPYALYLSINKELVCNSCSQSPENKWVGENHWLFADGTSSKKYGVA